MTLVLPMNPFLDPEADPPPSMNQPIWESERCTKTCLSKAVPQCTSGEQCTQGTSCRKVPDQISVSRIAYFKRKFVDDDDEPPLSFRTYCQTVAPVLEERAHVLRLSLEKMRFIEDPEAFLRRSVLVNNLLRRLRTEILLQSADWCFPPNPAFNPGPCIPPPSTDPTHQAIHGTVPTRLCLTPQMGPPFRKRLRLLRGQGDLRPDCAQTCCCIYAAAGHYLHLPFSVYETALSTYPAPSHSSSLFHLASHSKLGLTVAIDDEDDDVEEEDNEEDEDKEEDDEEEDDEGRHAGPSNDLGKDKSNQKSRTVTLRGHACPTREGDTCMADKIGEEEEEEEQEQVVRPAPWDTKSTERQLYKVSFWPRRAQRQ